MRFPHALLGGDGASSPSPPVGMGRVKQVGGAFGGSLHAQNVRENEGHKSSLGPNALVMAKPELPGSLEHQTLVLTAVLKMQGNFAAGVSTVPLHPRCLGVVDLGVESCWILNGLIPYSGGVLLPCHLLGM